MKDIRILNRIIFILSLVGIIIALYVTQSFLRKSPIVCINTGCELVRKNPSSYIFGIPVPAIGLLGYSLLAIFSFLRTFSDKKYSQLLLPMVGITMFGTIFVSWFIYTQAFVIKAFCIWCIISAVNMDTMFILVFKSYLLQNKISN